MMSSAASACAFSPPAGIAAARDVERASVRCLELEALRFFLRPSDSTAPAVQAEHVGHEADADCAVCSVYTGAPEFNVGRDRADRVFRRGRASSSPSAHGKDAPNCAAVDS